jgi:putative membrane protein
MRRRSWLWVALGGLVLAEIGYPLVDGVVRARLVVVTVVIGYAISVAHAVLSRAALPLVLVTTGGGFAVEAVGVATGFPFGAYSYSDVLGPKLLGVPLVIPLAWTWMAWPSWLVAGLLVGRSTLRVPVAGLALASWDLFLDPQMVASGYWAWQDPRPALPGVPGIPISNYLGWLVVAVALMALLAAFPATSPTTRRDLGSSDIECDVRATKIRNGSMYALYLWTWASGVLAHAVFLGLPWSALWGGIGMGLVAVPLAVKVVPGLVPRLVPRLVPGLVPGLVPRLVPRKVPFLAPGRQEGHLPGDEQRRPT